MPFTSVEEVCRRVYDIAAADGDLEAALTDLILSVGQRRDLVEGALEACRRQPHEDEEASRRAVHLLELALTTGIFR